MGLNLFFKIVQIFVAIPKIPDTVRPIEALRFDLSPTGFSLFEIVKPDRAYLGVQVMSYLLQFAGFAIESNQLPENSIAHRSEEHTSELQSH